MTADRPAILLALGQILSWAGLFYVFPATLLEWEAEAGWTRTELTGAISLALAVSALAAPLAGRLIDAGHGPALMAGSAAAGGALVAGSAAVDSLLGFYLVWAAIGAALAGSLYDPCFAVVTRARGAAARGAITLITLVAGFAGTLSFPALHTLSGAFGLRPALVMAGLGTAVLAAPLLWLGARGLGRQVADAAGHDAPAPHRRAFLRRPVFWLLALTFALVAVVQGGLIHHFLPILDARGLSPQGAVLAVSLIGPMQVAGRLAMLASARWLSLHGVAFAALGAIAVAMAVLRFGGAAPAAIAAFVLLFGAAYGTVSILRPLIARELLGGQDFGAKSGALALPYLAASASAPWLAALVWAAGGYDLVLALATGLAALSVLAFAAARRAA